jgi:uncharacterized membrane protein
MLTDALMLEIAGTAARWFELAGIAAIILGTLVALAALGLGLLGVRPAGGPDDSEPIPVFRRRLGRSILTGLELLVAADIVRTVAIEPTLQNVAVLGLIVLIRGRPFFISSSLRKPGTCCRRSDRLRHGPGLLPAVTGRARPVRTALRFARSRGGWSPRSAPWASRASS